MWRNWNSQAAAGHLNSAAAEQHSLMDHQKKSNTDLPYGPAVPHPGTSPKVKAGTQRDAHTPMFSAAARGVKSPGVPRQVHGQTKRELSPYSEL